MCAGNSVCTHQKDRTAMLDTFMTTTLFGWPLANIVYLLTLSLIVIVSR